MELVASTLPPLVTVTDASPVLRLSTPTYSAYFWPALRSARRWETSTLPVRRSMALLSPSTSALPVPATVQLSVRVLEPPLKPASTTCMPSLQLTWICLASPLYTTYGVSASAVSVTLPPETATVCSLVLP